MIFNCLLYFVKYWLFKYGRLSLERRKRQKSNCGNWIVKKNFVPNFDVDDLVE